MDAVDGPTGDLHPPHNQSHHHLLLTPRPFLKRSYLALLILALNLMDVDLHPLLQAADLHLFPPVISLGLKDFFAQKYVVSEILVSYPLVL